MTSTTCEACGVSKASQRALESCERATSPTVMDKVCLLHTLCEDCYGRYRQMEDPEQEKFRHHLAEEGMGVALEI